MKDFNVQLPDAARASLIDVLKQRFLIDVIFPPPLTQAARLT